METVKSSAFSQFITASLLLLFFNWHNPLESGLDKGIVILSLSLKSPVIIPLISNFPSLVQLSPVISVIFIVPLILLIVLSPFIIELIG